MGQPSMGQGSPGAVRPLPLWDATATGAGAAPDEEEAALPPLPGATKPPMGARVMGASAWVPRPLGRGWEAGV